MGARTRSRRLGLTAVASLAVLSLGVTAVGQAQASKPGPAGSTSAKTAAKKVAAPDQVVTLVTGDRVTLHGGDPAKASIEPGPGRRGVTFRATRLKDRLLVIPSDVSAAVTSGRLDDRLFDVAGLVKAGYDDQASKVIPVLVSYQGKAKRSVPAGATVSRNLPVINGAALKVDKKNAAAFLKGAQSARSASGIDKLWLDGKRHVSLDQSVPQIGAPAAWQAGYTGKGVSVAVLDTGIDATHPDLAPQLAGGKNFTADPDGDQHGHGTHVASIIAGTAAASNGKYKGVAPGTRLYDGKVCDAQGNCEDSAMLAGMEWAANEVKAKVVNISVGGQDTPEIDPLEEAVNRLTAQTGTLFVIAAGNSGPGVGSIESPGSADAALTVGAVDKQDQLADFSSRGPRTGDGGLKPDVTAPGVDIVAARSKDAVIGDPVGDQYLMLSGTSMATPHTVGAAAILAQEHPSWKAAELKGALMASAKVAAGQTSYEQGAGRIDVAKAITQAVIAEPGGVSFGTALWPHTDDAPVTKTVSYRNLGDQAVTLALSASLTDAAGAPAPASAIRLSASSVTVPAGGTATVEATSDTRHNGPDGGYSGRITAAAAGISVVSPIAVTKEVESYTLKISQVGPDGKPSDGGSLVFGVTTPWFDFYGDPSGTSQVRLPRGDYLVQGDQAVARAGSAIYDKYTMVQPQLKLTSDQTVVLDARTAKPVGTTVPNKDADLFLADIGFDRAGPDETGPLTSNMMSFTFEGLHAANVGGPAPAGQMSSHVVSNWGQRSPEGNYTNTPYLYGLVNMVPDVYPTGFQRTVRSKDLATVTQTINATADRQAQRLVTSLAPGLSGAWTPIVPYDLPVKSTLYLEAAPVRWTTEVTEMMPTSDPGSPRDITRLTGPETTYQAGKSSKERFNAAVFAPTPLSTRRIGNDLELGVFSTTDADGHVGVTVTDTESSRLYRDGELVGESKAFGVLAASDLPAAKGTYKFVTSLDRSSVAKQSAKIDLTFTFSSAAAGATPQLIPLRTVGYQPAVDSKNTVKRSAVTVLPIHLTAQPGSTALPAVKKLDLKVSGDEGKTWKPATVVRIGSRYQAYFATPKGDSVSLKAQLVDAAGNTTDQTIIGAYQFR